MAKIGSTRFLPGGVKDQDFYGESCVPPDPDYSESEMEGIAEFEEFVQRSRLNREIRRRNAERKRNGKRLL